MILNEIGSTDTEFKTCTKKSRAFHGITDIARSCLIDNVQKVLNKLDSEESSSSRDDIELAKKKKAKSSKEKNEIVETVDSINEPLNLFNSIIFVNKSRNYFSDDRNKWHPNQQIPQ